MKTLSEHNPEHNPVKTRSTTHLPVNQTDSLKTQERTSALGRSLKITRQRWLAFVGTSIAVLIPSFWHKQIAAGDLGSHLYNAWLAQLVEQGKAPGARVRYYREIITPLLIVCLTKRGAEPKF